MLTHDVEPWPTPSIDAAAASFEELYTKYKYICSPKAHPILKMGVLRVSLIQGLLI